MLSNNSNPPATPSKSSSLQIYQNHFLFSKFTILFKDLTTQIYENINYRININSQIQNIIYKQKIAILKLNYVGFQEVAILKKLKQWTAMFKMQLFHHKRNINIQIITKCDPQKYTIVLKLNVKINGKKVETPLIPTIHYTR